MDLERRSCELPPLESQRITSDVTSINFALPFYDKPWPRFVMPASAVRIVSSGLNAFRY